LHGKRRGKKCREIKYVHEREIEKLDARVEKTDHRTPKGKRKRNNGPRKSTAKKRRERVLTVYAKRHHFIKGAGTVTTM